MLNFIFEVRGSDVLAIALSDHHLVEHAAKQLAEDLEIELENVNIRIA